MNSVKTKDKRIPELRLPGFSGEWKENRLGSVGDFFKGRGISKDDISEDGVNECIRYGELYTDYNEIINTVKSKTDISKEDSFSSVNNDLLTPSSGETALDIARFSCVKQNDVLLGGDLNILRLQGVHVGVFFAYYLSNFRKRNIAKFAQGNSVVHLYSSHLKKLKINVPAFSEQQKISEFLGSVDEWIDNLKKRKETLEKYKKGMMQKIFSHEIRFKDKDGKYFSDWEEKKLGKMDIYVSDGNYGEMYPNASEMMDAGIPFIRANNIKNHNVVWDDMKYIRTELHNVLKSGHLKEDDILVTTRGEIGMLAYVSKEFEGANINAQICLLRNVGNVSMKYLLNFLSSNNGQKQFKELQTGSALKQLPKGNLAEIKIPFPSFLEQEKIANFLISIDEMIDNNKKQITNAEKWKKGLMQGLFV